MIIINRGFYAFFVVCALYTAEIRSGGCVSTASTNTRGNQPVRSSVQTTASEELRTVVVAPRESAPATPALTAASLDSPVARTPASVHNVSLASQRSSPLPLGSAVPRDVLVPMIHRPVPTRSVATSPLARPSATTAPIAQPPVITLPVAQAHREWFNDMRVRCGVALFILYWYRKSISTWLYQDFNDQSVQGRKVRLNVP